MTTPVPHLMYRIIILWCISVGYFVNTDGRYSLNVPVVYVAFSGDLVFNYTIPSNVTHPKAFIKLLATSSNKKREITTRGLPVGSSSGNVRILCGTIEFAAPHLIEMHAYVGGPILVTVPLNVRWPNFNIRLPNQHIALTQPVTLYLTSEAACNSLLKRYSFQIDLEFTEDRISNSSSSQEAPHIVHTYPVLNIAKKVTEITYTCDIFDSKGKFQAILKNSFNMKKHIIESNILDVRWSSAYTLSIYSGSVFPCTGHLSVIYSQPECVSKEDKIRVYMLQREVSGSLAAPLQRKFVTERKADPDRTFVIFGCELFNHMAAGYCFVYVSMSKRGSVTDQRSYCISSHPDSVLPIDGGWGEWSPWGECSVTCGAGKYSRFRICDNPSPANGGIFCSGDPFEWRPCFSTCPDHVPETPLHSLQLDEKCGCGCHMTESEGEIIATGRCPGLSLWLISGRKNTFIKLSFRYFNFFKDKQWVKIRNGDSSSADLIAVSYGENEITEVRSTSDKMLIEFMTNSTSSDPTYHTNQPSSAAFPATNLSKVIHVHGFIASYTVRVRNTTSSLAAISIPQKTGKGSIWESTVTIVGISLCAVIVVVVLAFALYHKVFRKSVHKYSMTVQEETPTHVPKSTSMNSTPSHHSALSQGIEIDYDMERPLTGNNHKKKERKDSGAFISRGSSVSSTRSTASKNRFKTKADIEPGGSPKPPSRHYTPLSSPLVHNDVIEELKEEKTSLFNTSPLLNRKPRSPKIHPSPKIKKHLSANVHSPIKTKHDLLTRKRKEKNSKVRDSRIVMGSADTKCIIEKPSATNTPDSCGSITPTAKAYFIENIKQTTQGGDGAKDAIKNDEKYAKNDSYRSEPIQLQFVDKELDDAEIRKPGSGTSDDSCSPDKIEQGKQQTTSFIEKPDTDTKPRRPTSLTESYKISLSLSAIDKDKPPSADGWNSDVPNIDRHKDLPKPDGQSPKSPRQENSKNSTPKSVQSSSVNSSRSKLALSPARSTTSPSEVASENLEMEYDDYIEYDDTFSYFDPLETEKLQWKGVEKIGKSKKKDDETKDPEQK